MRHARSLLVTDGGVTTVELAIVLPVLLLLVIGIVDIAISVNALETVTEASREGAHYAIMHPTAAPSAIASAAAERTAPLVPSDLTVTTTYYNGSTFQPWPAGGLPTTSPGPSDIPVRVKVSYPWSAATILIGRFFGGGTAELHASSTMDTSW